MLDSFNYAYILYKEGLPDSETQGKLNSFIKSLKGTIRFVENAYQSYGFLNFQNPISKNDIFPQILAYQIKMDNFFPIKVPNYDEEAFTKSLYITNLPNGIKNAEIISLLNAFDPGASFEELIPNILTFIMPTKPNLLIYFLPYIKLKSETEVTITTDHFQVPIVIVSNLPSNFRKKEFSLFKCPYEPIKCEFQSIDQEDTSKTAYLSYKSNEEAIKAVEYFNFAQIDQNEISAVHYSDKQIKNYKDWEINVRRISPESKAFDLWHRFQTYGQILYTEIKRSSDSGSIYGVVQFFTKKSAEDAINDFKQTKSSINADYANNLLVCIYNISPSLDKQKIAQQFKKVSNVEIFNQPGTLSYALVSFQCTQAANSCFESNFTYEGVRWIFEKGYQTKEKKAKIKNLFKEFQKSNVITIKNLPQGTEIQNIIDLCHYGVIRYVSLQSGKAVVSFEEEKSAKEAFENLNQKEFNKVQITVELA